MGIDQLGVGTDKTRNEIETKRNETKQNMAKQNEIGRNATKSDETKQNRFKQIKTYFRKKQLLLY